jgi:tetratricopeptide (TPR) repeat protein
MRQVCLIVGLGALVLFAGCQDAGTWIDASAMDSAAADAALARGDRQEAVGALRRIVERAVPDDVAPEDGRVVQQDAYERWARIELERGDAASALALVDRGLALGERDDVFTANLLTLRGRAHEASGRDREAASDYHRALRIEEQLLDRVLGGGDE